MKMYTQLDYQLKQWESEFILPLKMMTIITTTVRFTT